MTEFDLKTAIKVIKAAKKLGLKSMRLGTLEFEFSNEESPRTRPTLKVSKKNIAKQELARKGQLEFSDAMRELETMHVEDPVGYERAIIENDLIDTDDSGEEEIAEVQHS